ncbi:protein-arginine omega-N asymmetric methyltransferase [Aureococcus anophagefferens]|nr:protein-arginine omega-N asymmetric methyltransferase [Aureococcus anophagefferens]
MPRRWTLACLALCATMTTANDVPAAEYFSEYGMMSHHMTMLLDVGRMQAYRSAILNDAAHFKDKVVLDVGTGTGVLAIWAAEAGARRVYAVEQSARSRSIFTERRVDEILEHMGSFDEIAPQLTEATGIDLTPLRGAYYAEFLRDVFRNAWIGPVPAEDVHANSAVALLDEKEIDGLVAWFDVRFAAFAAGDDVVWLDTSPGTETHWGQCAFLVSPWLEGPSSRRSPKPDARHDLDFTLLYTPSASADGEPPEEVAATYAITAEVRGFGDVDGTGDLDDLAGEPYDARPTPRPPTPRPELSIESPL